MIILVIGLVLALLYTHITAVLSSSGVAPYCDATLEDLKTKHPFKPAPALPHRPLDHHHLIASRSVVLDKNKSAAIWRHLVSKVSALMIGHSLDGYLDDMYFGVVVSGGSEAILHVVNHLIKGRRDDACFFTLLVDFKNAFNLVDREVMLREVCLYSPAISRSVEFCYSNPARLYYREHTLWSCQGVQQDDGTVVGDTLVVGKVLELIMEDGPMYGLHLNVYKTRVFWPTEDPRSRYTGVFPSNIARPTYDVKLLVVAKIDDPQCELLLLRSCTALRSSLERIVTTSGPGFGKCQWRFATLPFAFGELGIYSAGDVMNYAFLASRL
nr:hypothetical protein [Tanacetum cinerariifolium]